jgi:DNA-binding NtrC family response regulator
MGVEVNRSPKTVLYFGQRSAETKQVLASLAGRSDLRIVHVPMVESATWVLQGLPAQLIIVGPELATNVLADLFLAIDQLQPQVPVVALRPKVDEDLPSRSAQALSVLARPYATPVLLRLVDMALEAALLGKSAANGDEVHRSSVALPVLATSPRR